MNICLCALKGSHFEFHGRVVHFAKQTNFEFLKIKGRNIPALCASLA